MMIDNKGTIDEYLAAVPDIDRKALERIRAVVKSVAPDVTESISYGVPTFKWKGKPLIYMSSTKKHCALYGPSVVEHHELLAGYDTSKGTIRFPASKPPPASLLKTLLRGRMRDIDAAAATKRAPAKKRV